MTRAAGSLRRDELDQLRGRDRGRLDEEFRAHRSILAALARRLGFVGPAADDLTQATWATFLAVAPSFEGRSSVRTFLVGILRRKAFEARRSASRTTTVEPDTLESAPSSDGGPDQKLVAARLHAATRECVDRLPARERRAVEMRLLEEDETSNVVRRLGITANNLAVLLHRARAHLRDCLGAHGH